MKIYHTETQEDYDALMVELERQGCKWFNGVQMTKKPDNWGVHKKHTYVRVDGVYAFYDSVYFHEWRYPDIPITKYKAKVDDKMRFTKENVYKVFSQYRKDSNFPFNDLQDDIFKLDDTPEKVVVPKCFDEWFKEIEATYSNPDSAKTFALWKLCQQGFGHGYEDVHGEKIPYETDLGKWLFKNKMLAIDAVLNGYTIEPEKLYYIPLPDLETPDGLQQVLSKRKGDKNYFASLPASALQQRYTKEELEQVPEVYKPYAKPVINSYYDTFVGGCPSELIADVYAMYEADDITEQRYTVVIGDRYLTKLFIGRADFRFIEFGELSAWKAKAYQLTEAEIKEIDERYWAFAVPVQEVK